MVLLTAAHTILSLKVGGLPLILSMVTIRVRLSDRPFDQLQKIYRWGKQRLFKSGKICHLVKFLSFVCHLKLVSLKAMN